MKEIILKSKFKKKRFFIFNLNKEKFSEMIPSFNEIQRLIQKGELLGEERKEYKLDYSTYEDIKEDIIDIIKKPILYRSLEIDDLNDFLKKLKKINYKVGSHWTSSFYYALQHNPEPDPNNEVIILEAEIDPSDLNFHTIFRQNIIFPEEKEFHLMENQQLTLKKIYIRTTNEEIDVNFKIRV